VGIDRVWGRIRFARQYQELRAECQEILNVCYSGERLLRITLTNTSAKDWLRVWVGASATGVTLESFTSAIFTVRLACLLSSLVLPTQAVVTYHLRCCDRISPMLVWTR